MVSTVTEAINAGKSVEEVLDAVYDRLRDLVPFNRIGVALVNGERDRLTMVALRSDGPAELSVGFSGKLGGSSLETVLKTGNPRTINDLEEYLENKPQSEATRLMIREGMRSSLTLPLVMRGRPVGCIFFSSRSAGAYRQEHEAILKLISGHMAIALEKSMMLEDLARNQSLAAVGELAASVAHEIKNPLAGISGAVQVLCRSFPENDSRRPIAQELLNQVRRLDGTVRDLLIFARPWNPQSRPFDVIAFIDGVVGRMAGHLRVTKRMPARLTVHADPIMLEHVLTNVVQNAVDAMPGGGDLCVRVFERDLMVVVEISDTGVGISPQNHEKLFRPFFSTKSKGTGLGLAISKKLVESLGGTMALESEPGRGTLVRITLRGDLKGR